MSSLQSPHAMKFVAAQAAAAHTVVGEFEDNAGAR
jgi:hypothetical protein